MRYVFLFILLYALSLHGQQNGDEPDRIVEKYLVPTPPTYYYYYDENDTLVEMKGNTPDISVFRALYESFYDAPDGGREEMKELIHKLGIEAHLNFSKDFTLAFRRGVHIENENKGRGMAYYTGLGLLIHGFSFDVLFDQYDDVNSDKLRLAMLGIGFSYRIK